MTREEFLLKGWIFIVFVLPLAVGFACWRARRRDVPWIVVWVVGAVAAGGVGALGAYQNDFGGGGRFVSTTEWQAMQRSWKALTPAERADIRLRRGVGIGAIVLVGVGLSHGALGALEKRRRA